MDDRINCVISLAGSNYVEEAEKLSKPVLFMAGTKDKVVDADRWLVTAYNAVKGPAVYASLNGAIHTTCCSNPTAYSRYIISWFNGWFYNDNNHKDYYRLALYSIFYLSWLFNQYFHIKLFCANPT